MNAPGRVRYPERSLLKYALWILLLLSMTAEALWAACPGALGDDRTFTSTNDYLPQKFIITRVVGPGTSGEFSESPTGGNLKYWQQYIDNGVLSEKACVDLVAVVNIHQPAFWNYLHQVAANGTLDVTVKVDFSLNGAHIGEMQWEFLGVDSPAAIPTPPKRLSVNLYSKYLRFARRPDQGVCNVAQGAGNCPGVNTIETKIGIVVRQHLFDLGSIGAHTNLPAGTASGALMGGMPFCVDAGLKEQRFRPL